MGNYISCTLTTQTTNGSTKGTKVIFPSGEVRRIYTPMEAGELMLEAPSHFLANAKSLQLGRRFSPLNADERLEIGSVYVFFPMRRRNEVVAAADIAPLFMAVRKEKRVSLGCVRILPESVAEVQVVRRSEEVAQPKLNLEDIEEFSTPEFKHRLSITRSKKPELDTIVEEPLVRSRWSC